MSAFPTVWELLIPNWSIWTILGVLLVILGILIYKVSGIAKALGLNSGKYGTISILSGIVMMWGFSAIEDFLEKSGGQMIFWGIIIILIVGIFLFYEPKKKGKKR